ncbi:MAG: radical SAM protein [Deltaproteobacteria bacterium]|nr:radical SAM protein [Deltaproteobacteria bacterium]
MKTNKTVAFSKNATNVFFHILTSCNLKCRHCYINPDQHGKNTLPIDTIKKWLAVFAKPDHPANVIFLGGEPTLHPDLAGSVKHARTLGYGSVTIDTNGYLFHNILDRVTPDEVDYFSFSLDGATAPTNDSIRGKGCYDHCIAGIRQAIAKGFNTSLIYTVSTANLHELEMMVPLLNELGIHRFFIQVIGIRGKSAKGTMANDSSQNAQVASDQWMRIIPAVAEESARLGITVTYPKVFLKADEPFECAGLTAKNFFIFPNGRVYRCPLCEDFPLHQFEFRQDKLVEMGKINEKDLFQLSIPEGCVMNRIIQPDNLAYGPDGIPEYKIACCLLKEEVALSQPGQAGTKLKIE